MNSEIKVGSEIKLGSISVVLGNKYFQAYVPPIKNKLLKVTRIFDRHNEFKHLGIIRTIEKYNDYYSIPDDITFSIKPGDPFYEYIKRIVDDKKTKIFTSPLHYFFINNAGDKELLDTIIDIETKYDYSFWKSYKTILNFSKTIMESIGYLHDKKLCHLDIKPENIMVDTKTGKFKIIDFGFASLEPFDDYIYDIRGTPGYFPQYFPNDKMESWLPRIEALDMIKVDGEIPIQKDYKQVYKIDSYCFGRVLYFLKYIYKENAVYMCFNTERVDDKMLDEIINSLIEKSPYKRLTIKECLKKFF
jgi:hypothetical protein